MEYKTGDIRNWTWTDADCKIANETLANFDGWLRGDLELYEVEKVRNDILEAIRLAKYGYKLWRSDTAPKAASLRCQGGEKREEKL